MTRITIAAARTNCGMTQGDLAEKMGVSRCLVNEWETGKREMRTPYFRLFCLLTGFSEEEIILPIKSTASKP